MWVVARGPQQRGRPSPPTGARQELWEWEERGTVGRMVAESVRRSAESAQRRQGARTTGPLGGDGAEERRRVAALIARFGIDALCHVHLRPDRSYLFAPDDAGVVSYVVDGRVALLGGDPVAAPSALPRLVRQALDTFAAQRLAVCVVGASATAAHAYAAAGLRAMKLGEEAVVDLPNFDVARLRPKVRRAARHIAACGVTLHVGTMATLDTGLVAQCPAVSRAWLADHGGVTQGFSMTTGAIPDQDDDLNQVVLAARDGQVLGFLTLAQTPACAGLSLDHMRRLRDSPNGLMEALIIHACAHFRDAGVRTLSLNFAPLSDAACPEGEGTAIRALRRALVARVPGRPAHALYLFNRKFASRWTCRYWLFGGKGDLWAACRATLRAEVATPLPLPQPVAAACLAATVGVLPDRMLRGRLGRLEERA